MPVRFEDEIEARLERAAVKTGTTKSALIRMLATTFVTQCVGPDGRVTLPPNWKELLSPRDNRSVQKVILEPSRGDIFVKTPFAPPSEVPGNLNEPNSPPAPAAGALETIGMATAILRPPKQPSDP